jgi:hypothetical protein
LIFNTYYSDVRSYMTVATTVMQAATARSSNVWFYTVGCFLCTLTVRLFADELKKILQVTESHVTITFTRIPTHWGQSCKPEFYRVRFFNCNIYLLTNNEIAHNKMSWRIFRDKTTRNADGPSFTLRPTWLHCPCVNM